MRAVADLMAVFSEKVRHPSGVVKAVQRLPAERPRSVLLHVSLGLSAPCVADR